jgi:SAM-dependent methyltransferase
MESLDNPAQEIPKSEIIDQLMESFYRIGALRAALELQLWGKIAAGEETAEQIAAQEGWDPTGTRALLEAMCALKLMDKAGDRYSLVPESAYYLVPGKPTYKGGLLQNEYHWEGNGKLAQAIRSGKRPVHYDAATADVVNIWIADYSRRWVYPESCLEADDELWRSLGIQAHAGLRVLDLACGPAPRSMALRRQHPGVRLTWLDWEEILQTALKTAAQVRIENQVSLLPGDLWSVDFGDNQYDVAYLGNVTHFFSPEENTRLFCKVYYALAPGGTIVVNSAARREMEEAGWADLWLYTVTASGGAHGFKEYQQMLESAGFREVEDVNSQAIKGIKLC